MTDVRPSLLLIGFCGVLAGCSDSTPRTILLTNALGFDYTVLAFDEGDTASRDTVLAVPSGTQVCWRLADSKPTPFTVELDSYDDFGNALASTVVEPRFKSWTWDGAGPDASGAPAC